ncbi:hypothetical protein ACNS7O_09315 [Haloferacaceae archaeon DSL9]
MTHYEAVFEIDSPSDARAIESMLTRLHDSLREESMVAGGSEAATNEMLTAFASVRDAVDHDRPGRLTIVYESFDETDEP